MREVPYYGDASQVVCPNCEDIVDVPAEMRKAKRAATSSPFGVPHSPHPLVERELYRFHQCKPADVAARQAADLREAFGEK